jgi:hypothetical protein
MATVHNLMSNFTERSIDSCCSCSSTSARTRTRRARSISISDRNKQPSTVSHHYTHLASPSPRSLHPPTTSINSYSSPQHQQQHRHSLERPSSSPRYSPFLFAWLLAVLAVSPTAATAAASDDTNRSGLVPQSQQHRAATRNTVRKGKNISDLLEQDQLSNLVSN